MKWLIWVIVIVLIFAFSRVSAFFLKRSYMKRIMKLIDEEDYDVFFRMIDSVGCRYAFPVYFREFMRFNVLLETGITKDVAAQVDILMGLKQTSPKQKVSIAIRAFYYFIEKKDMAKCRDMIHIVRDCGNAEVEQELRMIAGVMLQGESKYIEQFKTYYEQAEEGYQKSLFAYMIALQYDARGERKNSEKYLKEAAEGLKHSPYEKEIRRMLGKKEKEL